MKIRFDNNSANFSSLEEGEVFHRKYDSEIFMKIEEVYSDGEPFNSVILMNGKLINFNDDELVLKTNSELIIKG